MPHSLEASESRTSRLKRLRKAPAVLGPGVLACSTVAVAAQFVADRYGAPAMLMALLLGMAFHFLAEDGRCVQGIEYSAQGILRIGVGLLGVRISVDLLLELGTDMILLLVLAIVLTILIGLLCSRLLGRGWRFGVLTGGSVAICGASAAMAIAAVLPKNEYSERNLTFTILGVTVLSTIAMVIYPIFTQLLELDDRTAGFFLGGTIHDVAQVVGAGFSVSEETGETATLVKLIRVTMLAPVVIGLSLAVRNAPGDGDRKKRKAPLIPGFVLAFLALASANSFGMIPQPAVAAASDVSRWALLLGIAAVGMKTSLNRIVNVGGQAVILIVAETAFIAAFILAGLRYAA
jgi:uncharacterized integral membrane protein (TIGR00698 family)